MSVNQLISVERDSWGSKDFPEQDKCIEVLNFFHEPEQDKCIEVLNFFHEFLY